MYTTVTYFIILIGLIAGNAIGVSIIISKRKANHANTMYFEIYFIALCMLAGITWIISVPMYAIYKYKYKYIQVSNVCNIPCDGSP